MTVGSPGGGRDGLRIGVVLEAFLDWPLERILSWLPEAAPEVTHLEVGVGGYAPHSHCDVAALLASRAGPFGLAGRHRRVRAEGRRAERLGQPAAPRSGRAGNSSTTARPSPAGGEL